MDSLGKYNFVAVLIIPYHTLQRVERQEKGWFMIPPRRYTSITVTFRDAKAGERKMALYSSGCLSVDVLPNSPAGPFRHQRARTHAREERRKYMHSSSMWRRHMIDVAS